jgi:hypothetical protein
VCTSDELRDLPKKMKLLCEELVVFRDKKGRVGALEPHCSHRGTSLEWGRVEKEGLRCCYHGWLYDAQRPGTDTVQDIRPGSALTRKYEDRQRKPDDLEAQESQRPIAVHALENLGTSDTGITMLRHLLREQIKRVEDGLDPMNVMRDARANHKIPTNAWNTILSPDETSLHQANEVLWRVGEHCGLQRAQLMGR